MRGVGLFILGLGAVSLLNAVAIAAVSGLVVMAVTLGVACALLAAIGTAVLLRWRGELRAHRGTATIMAVVGDGDGHRGGDRGLDLTVVLPGHCPYRATVATVVPEAAAAHCVPGSTVPVSVDPYDLSAVVVDWRAQAPHSRLTSG